MTEGVPRRWIGFWSARERAREVEPAGCWAAARGVVPRRRPTARPPAFLSRPLRLVGSCASRERGGGGAYEHAVELLFLCGRICVWDRALLVIRTRSRIVHASLPQRVCELARDCFGRYTAASVRDRYRCPAFCVACISRPRRHVCWESVCAGFTRLATVARARWRPRALGGARGGSRLSGGDAAARRLALAAAWARCSRSS